MEYRPEIDSEHAERASRAHWSVAGLALSSILVVLVATALLLWNLREREIDHAHVELTSLTEMLVKQTQQTFESADLILRGVRERLQTPYGERFSLNSLQVHFLLGARVSGMEQTRSLFLIDTEGRLVNSSLGYPVADLSASDREYYRAFLDGKRHDLFVGKPVIGRVDNSWTIHLARRLDNADGSWRGVIVISLNLAYFESIYNIAKLDFERPIALYLDDGTLVASLPRRPGDIGKTAVELGAQGGARGSQTGVALYHRQNPSGNVETYSLARVDGFPLLVSVVDDFQEALAGWRDTARSVTVSVVVLVISIVVVSTILIVKLRREQQLVLTLRETDERYMRTVESSNRQLRELSNALEHVREQERTHLSRELHDELGQHLTGLKLDLAWLGRRIEEGRSTGPEALDAMDEHLNTAIATVRQISTDLRPPILDDQGFVAAIQWLSEETQRRSGIRIDLDIEVEPDVCGALATPLFRIAQEALTNIVRHAHASRACVRLVARGDDIVLSVSDNGGGFSPVRGGNPGIGLISMRERVTSLQGVFTISDNVDGGVTVEAAIPCPPLLRGEQPA